MVLLATRANPPEGNEGAEVGEMDGGVDGTAVGAAVGGQSLQRTGHDAFSSDGTQLSWLNSPHGTTGSGCPLQVALGAKVGVAVVGAGVGTLLVGRRLGAVDGALTVGPADGELLTGA